MSIYILYIGKLNLDINAKQNHYYNKTIESNIVIQCFTLLYIISREYSSFALSTCINRVIHHYQGNHKQKP